MHCQIITGIQTKVVPTFSLSSCLWDCAYFHTSQAFTFPYPLCTLKLPVHNCHEHTKQMHFLVNFIYERRCWSLPGLYSGSCLFKFSNVFYPVEVKWVLSGTCCPLFPSLKCYRSLNKDSKNMAITFELYRKRKCQLIVFETKVPRLIKYLVLHRRQN